MKFLIPVALCVGICLCGGAVLALLEQWTGPMSKGGDSLDLVIGLGVMGTLPGLGWARMERKMQDQGAARRRLLLYCLGFFVAFGAAGAILLTGLSAGFTQAMKTVGFLPTDGSSLRPAALGFVYASLPGLALGYLLAARASLKANKST